MPYKVLPGVFDFGTFCLFPIFPHIFHTFHKYRQSGDICLPEGGKDGKGDLWKSCIARSVRPRANQSFPFFSYWRQAG
jgi:hypothetical protein